MDEMNQQTPTQKPTKLRVLIVVAASLITMVLTAAFVLLGSNNAEEGPTATDEQSENNSSVTASDDGDENDGGKDDELRKIKTMFADTPKVKKESEALIDDLDEAIESMDELIAKANQASNEDCELVQIYFEIDKLKLVIKKGNVGQHLEAFSKAVEADILGQEFAWEPEEETLEEDFDFTALDENVLGADFDAEATDTGKELKTEIIKLRQRQRKILDQTRRLKIIDSRQALIDPSCSPITY